MLAHIHPSQLWFTKVTDGYEAQRNRLKVALGWAIVAHCLRIHMLPPVFFRQSGIFSLKNVS
jgi:hypothetical protein